MFFWPCDPLNQKLDKGWVRPKKGQSVKLTSVQRWLTVLYTVNNKFTWREEWRWMVKVKFVNLTKRMDKFKDQIYILWQKKYWIVSMLLLCKIQDYFIFYILYLILFFVKATPLFFWFKIVKSWHIFLDWALNMLCFLLLPFNVPTLFDIFAQLFLLSFYVFTFKVYFYIVHSCI